MAIDNTLYDSLQDTYIEIQNYFNNTQLGREHSQMMIKHEELAELLERLDIEAIEEQSKDIHELHKQLQDITDESLRIVEELQEGIDSMSISKNIVTRLDKIFLETAKLIV